MAAEQVSLYGPIIVMLVAFLWGSARILYLSRSENVSVLTVLARKKTVAEKALILVAIILDGYLFLRPFVPGLDDAVFAFGFAYPFIGVAIMVLGIALAIASQAVMGLSWRIGVPEEKEASQSLVTTGFYRYSRNPIYVGIMLFLIGTIVTVPSPFTLSATLLTALLIHPIIKREETFLTEAFGREYTSYCQEVRRWI